MEFTAVIKARLKSDEELDLDMDTLADAISDAIDNTDIEVDGQNADEDETLNMGLEIEDIEVTMVPEQM